MSLDWSTVAARLSGARTYWLAVVDRRGGPRTFPHWGVVVDEAFHFFLPAATGVAVGLRRDPRIALNLEDGEFAVLVRGKADPIGSPADRPEIISAFAAKYDDPNDSRFPYVGSEPDRIYRLMPTWALVTEETAARPFGRAARDPRARIWELDGARPDGTPEQARADQLRRKA